MSNLPTSLIDTASEYSKLGDNQKKTFLASLLVKHNYSVSATAKLCKTYANKIRRDAKTLEIPIPNKSQAQSAAISSGRHKHPTKGTKRPESVKNKIGDSMAKVWENLSEAELLKRSQMSKAQWDEKSPAEKELLRRLAGDQVRIAAKDGSKFEHYLLKELIAAGYKVEFHKEYFLVNERLQIDLYLPILSIAIEVDGPSHFEPIWGEETLRRNQAADSAKNGLLLSTGLCVIRVRQTKNLSKAFMRKALRELLGKLQNIEAKFPDKNNRFIELGA